MYTSGTIGNTIGANGNANSIIVTALPLPRQRIESYLIPQDTVLGPLLFSLHINDIMSDIESEIRLFADDCVCYREFKDIEDTLKLQTDIDRLGIWARKWDMRFQPVKCNIEVFKIVNNMSPGYISDLVKIKTSVYDFRDQKKADVPRVNSTRYGLRSFRSEAARVWNSLPNEVRLAESFLSIDTESIKFRSSSQVWW